METKDLLFALLRSEISGEAIAEDAARTLAAAAEDFRAVREVLYLAQKHDLGHIVAAALMRSAVLCKPSNAAEQAAESAEREAEREKLSHACERLQMTAVFRYEGLRFALGEISRVLSQAKIAFMPLKGAVVRALYPEPWHRSSCDVDILVHEEDLERACEALREEAGYRVEGGKNFHDIHLYSPQNVHLELHFNILSGNEKSDLVLSRVWENASENENNSFHFVQSDAFYLFHHTAHMAYHFAAGGCGIKPFMDLYILDRYKGIDEETAMPLLKAGGKDIFLRAARDLAAVWFGGREHTETTRKLEAVVLSGGVYGSVENKVILQQSRQGGRLRYALSRIFLSRKSLSRIYPVLEKHAWLLPVMQVRRWFKLVFGGRLRYAARELGYNNKVSGEEGENARRFLEDLGL